MSIEMDLEILPRKEENLRSSGHSEQEGVEEYCAKPCSSLSVSLPLPSKKRRKLIMCHSENEEDDCHRNLIGICSDYQATEIRKEECDFFRRLRKVSSEVVNANKDAKSLEIDISSPTDTDLPKEVNLVGENFYRFVTQLSSQGEVKKEMPADSLSPAYFNVPKQELENNSSRFREGETFTASKVCADFSGPQMANGKEILKSIKKNEVSKGINDSNESKVAKELNDSVKVERETPLKIGDDDLVPSNAEKSNNIAMSRKRRRTRKDRIAEDNIALTQSKRMRMMNTKNGNAGLSYSSLHCNSTCHDGKAAKTEAVSRKKKLIDLSADEQKEDSTLRESHEKEVDKGEVEATRTHHSISCFESSTSPSFKTNEFERSWNKQDQSPATATPSHVDKERSSSSADVGSGALDVTSVKRIIQKRRELKRIRRTSSYRKLKPIEFDSVLGQTKEFRKSRDNSVQGHKNDHAVDKISDLEARKGNSVQSQKHESWKRTDKSVQRHKRVHAGKRDHTHEEPKDSGKSRINPFKRHKSMHEEQSKAANSPPQGQKIKRRKARYGMSVQRSSKGEPNREEAKPVIKRTVLSWLLDRGVLSENERVQYLNNWETSASLEGRVVKEGIFCGCCRSVISVTEFTNHAGNTNRSQPFENVYFSSGKSWAQCLIEAWDKEDKCRKSGKHVVDLDEDDQNDGTCGLCGDGGDLICCDRCPSTFHQDCLGLQNVPDGDWYCLNCSCRICRTTGCLLEEANVNGLFCEQCETYYHRECLNAEPHVSEYSPSRSLSFCGHACKEVFEGLQNLLGKKNDLEGGFSWTLARHFDDDYLNSYSKYLTSAQMAECNAMVAVAYNVMDECFVPIIDPRTNIDMVTNVVFGSWCNLPRLNYKGFYMAVLEKDDEFISVASIRIHGTRIAEMPLIGTRHQYRRQGMCHRLVNVIEEMLQKLNVENLILPAIPELLRTWTSAFGFQPLKDEHKNEIRSMNLMVFPGTDLLQKGI